MKKFIILGILTFIIVMVWLNTDFSSFDKNKYITSEVMDKSVPIDVTIDLNLINDLVPADER